MPLYTLYHTHTHTQWYTHMHSRKSTHKRNYWFIHKNESHSLHTRTHTVSISISVFALKLWQKCKTFSLCSPRFMQHFYDIFHHFIWLVFILGLPQLRSPFRSNWLTVCFPSLLLFSFHVAATQRIQCLLVTDINVPQIVDFRDNVTLSCSYDISGHTLNSVKWYKNDSEFFR